ncbi:MAG: DsbA family protein [Acidimicrobiia bacterium]
MSRPVLTYVFDAYCGWCYGFSPAFAALVEHVGDRADIRVVNGGLFIDDRSKPIGSFGHIPQANERISQLTGVTFGPDYEQVLREGTLVMDSLDAAAGFNALRNAAPERETELPSAIQHAWYRNGRSLSDPATYAQIARDFGLDGDAVAADAASEAARDQAREEFAAADELGVHEYPTLLLTVDGVTRRLGGPVTKPDQLIAQFETAVARSD